jgi:uncharacterized protein
MVTRDTAWPEGTPCWAGLSVRDVDRARAFYAGLFGWDIPAGPAEAGGYSVASLGGKAVAGIGPEPGLADGAWITYIACDDADTTAARIEEAGGKLITGPLDVMAQGRMATALDISGSVFGVWQSMRRTGMELANEPGAVTWNEQMSADYDGSRAFYHAVFGYEYGDMSGDGYRYASLKLDGRDCGGIGELGGALPWPAFPGWQTYFCVVDPDATMALAADLGGTIVREAMPTPYGRIGVVADDQGAMFSVISVVAK